MTPPILRAPTPARWLPLALSDVDTLLLDHAHCEKKAASTLLSFVFRAPELAATFSRVVREELVHFEMVVHEIERRGRRFERLPPAAYAGRLVAACWRRPEPEALLAALVAAALIEARSCERLGLLAEAVPEPRLAALYRALHPAEERHHALLLDAASRFGDPQPRLERLAEIEAAIVVEGEDLVRMHA